MEKPLYHIPMDLQGSTDTTPQCVDGHYLPWQCLSPAKAPLQDDPSTKIDRYDNILITTVSDDNPDPHNECGKVLDCREHDGTHYIVVAWWVERSQWAKAPNFKRKLPSDAPFEFILGGHVDVITSESVVELLPDDGRFCKTVIYHNNDILPAAECSASLPTVLLEGEW